MTWAPAADLERAIRWWARGDDDMAQEMRIACWRAYEANAADPRVDGLMFRVARNTRANLWRDAARLKRAPDRGVELTDAHHPEISPVECGPVDWTSVDPVLVDLHVLGRTCAEIAAVRGVTPAAVWVHGQRAAARLRKAWGCSTDADVKG